MHVTRITSHADLPGGKAVEQDAGDEHVMLDEGSIRRGRVRYVGKREELRPHDKKVKRDHYVPCWLSKGFTDTGERSGKFTVFRRGRDPYRGTPEGWGVEHGFYTEGDANIDVQWADSEGADGKLLDRLRRDGVQAGDANDIPGLLTRLAARTKNTREMFVQCAEEVGETSLAGAYPFRPVDAPQSATWRFASRHRARTESRPSRPESICGVPGRISRNEPNRSPWRIVREACLGVRPFGVPGGCHGRV